MTSHINDETFTQIPSAPPADQSVMSQDHQELHQSVIHGSNDKGLLEVPNQRRHPHPVFMFPSPIQPPASTPVPMVTILEPSSDVKNSHHHDQNNNHDDDQELYSQVNNNNNRHWSERTEYKRTQYTRKILEFITEIVLPLVSIISNILLIVMLRSNFTLMMIGVGLFLLPNILFLFFYFQKMLHRREKMFEVVMILLLGPLLRWLCSVRLMIVGRIQDSGLYVTGLNREASDLELFVTAAKMIDGIFSCSVKIVWLLYLIAVKAMPVPVLSWRMVEKQDWFGNVVHMPSISSLTLLSSLGILVKNLAQLWMINIPSNHEDILQTEDEASENRCKLRLMKLMQWTLLTLFVTTAVLFRLLSYALIFVHLFLFYLPLIIILIIFSVHIILRGVCDDFYVESERMDVFQTAVCSSLVPTPSFSNIKAHNLLQVHSTITNFILMVSLAAIMFLNLDYNLPIISRPAQMSYSAQPASSLNTTLPLNFFDLCLVTTLLLQPPSSALVCRVGGPGERVWSRCCWCRSPGLDRQMSW